MMKHVVRMNSSLLALMGLVAAPSFAAPAQQGHQQDPQEQPGRRPGQQPGASAQNPSEGQSSRLPFQLGDAQSYAFRVEHRNANPLGAGEALGGKDRAGSQGNEKAAGGERAGMYEPGGELRFELRPQRSSQQGQKLIQVDVSRSNGLGAVGGKSGQAGSSASGDSLTSFQALVDDQGNIVRLERSRAGANEGGAAAGETGHAGESGQGGQAGGSKSAATGGEYGGLDENELRCDLALILGSGLHAQALQKGDVYEVGKAGARPIEASAPRNDGLQGASGFALRFEGVREGLGAATGNESNQPGMNETKSAANFTVLPSGANKNAAGMGHETGDTGKEQGKPEKELGGAAQGMGAEMTKGSIGNATYSLGDGLVVRFEARPDLGLGGMEHHAGAGDENEHGEDSNQAGGRGHELGGKEGMHHGRWVTIERLSAR